MKKIIPIMLIMILVTGCGCNKKEDKIEEKKYNTKEEIKKEQNIEELKIEFISLEYENKVSTLKTRVTNEKEEKQEEKYINIKYKNKEGKVVHTQLGYVKALDPNETTILVSNSDSDLSEVEKVEYEVIK